MAASLQQAKDPLDSSPTIDGVYNEEETIMRFII